MLFRAKWEHKRILFTELGWKWSPGTPKTNFTKNWQSGFPSPITFFIIYCFKGAISPTYFHAPHLWTRKNLCGLRRKFSYFCGISQRPQATFTVQCENLRQAALSGLTNALGKEPIQREARITSGSLRMTKVTVLLWSSWCRRAESDQWTKTSLMQSWELLLRFWEQIPFHLPRQANHYSEPAFVFHEPLCKVKVGETQKH